MRLAETLIDLVATSPQFAMPTDASLMPELEGVDLKTLTYETAESLLSTASDEVLVSLFDSASIKIGDTAVSCLLRRDRWSLIVDGVHEGRFRTRAGKIRAANYFSISGKWVPKAKALPALMILAADRGLAAADNALLPIVLWQDPSVLPQLNELYEERPTEALKKAIKAIKKRDYRIYVKGYRPHAAWLVEG